MEELKRYAHHIAVLLRLRYELTIFEIDCTESVEALDSTLFSFIQEMLKEFNIATNSAYALFLRFFWYSFIADDEYKQAYERFGKDFAFTEDFLKEILEERIFFHTL